MTSESCFQNLFLNTQNNGINNYGKFQSFLTEKHYIQFSITQD